MNQTSDLLPFSRCSVNVERSSSEDPMNNKAKGYLPTGLRTNQSTGQLRRTLVGCSGQARAGRPRVPLFVSSHLLAMNAFAPSSPKPGTLCPLNYPCILSAQSVPALACVALARSPPSPLSGISPARREIGCGAILPPSIIRN